SLLDEPCGKCMPQIVEAAMIDLGCLHRPPECLFEPVGTDRTTILSYENMSRHRLVFCKMFQTSDHSVIERDRASGSRLPFRLLPDSPQRFSEKVDLAPLKVENLFLRQPGMEVEQNDVRKLSIEFTVCSLEKFLFLLLGQP